MSVLLTRPERELWPPLGRFGSAPALVYEDRVVGYDELDALVRERRERLGRVRRLVLLECANDVDTVVGYLAAVTGGHPVVLAPPGDNTDLHTTYAPDVVLSGPELTELHEGTRHDLHPELALLLSTSGSTGSPKLVRLSHANVRSNAEAIATYLGLNPDDRAATTLPTHYCYGLSVVNSHLCAGASLLLTDASVVDDALWDDVVEHRVTSFAGVPHTFDLLDASGFEERDLGALRYITQAGGRLAPERVRRFARLGRQRGFELFVMYGQTEATARMTYLPPHLAESRPECVGVPIPGGSLRIDGGGEVGELVYTGPNVMLGYATAASDLAVGRSVAELRTGDLARRHPDGLVEVVGRHSRFAKVFGLRIDLDRVERLAADHGVEARVVEHDGRLALFVRRHLDVTQAYDVAERCGVPRTGASVHVLPQLPVTCTGKPDHPALARHAAVLAEHDRAPRSVTPVTVRDELAFVLGRPDATEDDSFVTLGGDSLSFVEVSLRLEDLIGDLPPRWPEMSARDLATLRAQGQRQTCRQVESALVLRAVAIVLIVGTHANLLAIMGGAHVLLAVCGFQVARFQLTDRPSGDRVRGLLRACARMAVPAGLFITGAGLATGMYDASTALFLNNLLGSDDWDLRWQFWFLEVVVWTFAGLAALFSVPRIGTLERQHPWGFAAVVLAVTATLRFGLVGIEAEIPERYSLPVVLWCVALGWTAARARTTLQRVLVTAAAGALTFGFFDDLERESIVVGGVVLLTWIPSLALPRIMVPALSVLAASSFWVYLTHWQVYPHLEDDHPFLATVASFAVGVACWRIYTVRSKTLAPARAAARRGLRSARGIRRLIDVRES